MGRRRDGRGGRGARRGREEESARRERDRESGMRGGGAGAGAGGRVANGRPRKTQEELVSFEI